MTPLTDFYEVMERPLEQKYKGVRQTEGGFVMEFEFGELEFMFNDLYVGYEAKNLQ